MPHFCAFCQVTHSSMSCYHPGNPANTADIPDPENYWKRVGEEMAKWKPVEEDDGPDVPTFL